MLRLLLFLSVIQSMSTCNSVKSPVWEITDLADAEQAVMVSAKNETTTDATLQRYEKAKNGWQKVGSEVPVKLGRSGLAWGAGLQGQQPGQQKKEGDGKSPAGIFPLNVIFGTAPSDETKFRMPYLHISEVVECVDDPTSNYYNQLVNNRFVEKDWSSSEEMLNVGAPYEWGVLVGHNSDNKPGGGSCIFLHVWKTPKTTTSGCTAMAKEDLVTILNWLDSAKRPVLIQGVHPVLSLKY